MSRINTPMSPIERACRTRITSSIYEKSRGRHGWLACILALVWVALNAFSMGMETMVAAPNLMVALEVQQVAIFATLLFFYMENSNMRSMFQAHISILNEGLEPFNAQNMDPSDILDYVRLHYQVDALEQGHVFVPGKSRGNLGSISRLTERVAVLTRKADLKAEVDAFVHDPSILPAIDELERDGLLYSDGENNE